MSVYKVYLGFINIPTLLGFILPITLCIMMAFIINNPLSKMYWSISLLIGLITLGILAKVTRLKYLDNMIIAGNIGLGLIIIIFISFLIEKITLVRILY
jgi:hypothetical protein